MLPSEVDGNLVKFVNTINETLSTARKRMTLNLCPICGGTLFDGALFCGNCGYRLVAKGEKNDNL